MIALSNNQSKELYNYPSVDKAGHPQTAGSVGQEIEPQVVAPWTAAFLDSLLMVSKECFKNEKNDLILNLSKFALWAAKSIYMVT